MRLIALAEAQVKDVFRNPMLAVFLLLVPVISAAMKATMPESTHSLLATMLFLMSAYFVGWNVPSVTLAEEKEKQQLEALFLTPVRPWQVVLVKGGLALAGCLGFGLLALAIFGQAPARPLLWLGSYTVLSLFTVGAGTLAGLLFKDMRTLGAAGTPILLLLLFASTLPWATVQPGFWEVQAWLPTRPAVELTQASFIGEAMAVGSGGVVSMPVPVLRNLLVMLAYVALVWLLNARLIRRLSFAGR